MYKQTLYKVVKPIKLNAIKRLNKSKKWKYGYNKESNIVSISKNGQIGEILEIQGFQIALPKQPKEIFDLLIQNTYFLSNKIYYFALYLSHHPIF